MKTRLCCSLRVVGCLLTWLTIGWAQTAGDEELPRRFHRFEFKVDGVIREALVYVPPSAKTTPTPVVFVFHGHGGDARNAARSFAMDRHWPEAISVYMQGLSTPGRLTDPAGKRPGWQHGVGDQQDRDLKFFDAVLGRLKRDYRVDGKRIYATGHSNGGGFTYLLWAARGDVLERLPRLISGRNKWPRFCPVDQ